jgi:ATP-binding cassette subfamily F protein uup
LAELSKEKESINVKLNSGQLPYEELQKLSQRIIDVSHQLDEKELRWLELSEISE